MPLSAKQCEYLAVAWQCMESEPKIDYEKFKSLAGLTSAHSARELLRVTKKKLREEYGPPVSAAAGAAGTSAPATPKTPATAGRKRATPGTGTGRKSTTTASNKKTKGTTTSTANEDDNESTPTPAKKKARTASASPTKKTKGVKAEPGLEEDMFGAHEVGDDEGAGWFVWVDGEVVLCTRKTRQGGFRKRRKEGNAVV